MEHCNEIEPYFSLIKKTLQSDVTNPRHLTGYDILKSTDTLYIVSEDGTLLICNAKDDKPEKFLVKTCYRPEQRLNPDFKRLAKNDAEWSRLNTIKEVESRVQNPNNFANVEKILEENW